MRRFIVLGVAASVAATTVAQGQGIDPQCTAGQTQDACQKTVDVFKYMVPQFGVLMTGGNATLGQGGTLGGLGHFLVGVRANVMQGSLPQIDKVTPSTNAADSTVAYPVKSQILGLPQVDAAIGIFKGIPLGVTNVGGVDLLVSAEYLPSVNSSSVDITVPNGSLKLGFGARLGIIQESVVFPGVAITYLRRDLPTVDLSATSSAGDSLNINKLDVTTDAWRLVASKSFLIFGLSGGVGRDDYSASTAARAYVAAGEGASTGTINLSEKVSRTNAFFDLSLNLPLIKLVGEVGHVSGGTINTYNQFSGTRADDSRTYESVGLRFGF
ncbi:MAG TPA: hypothetical protein VNU46_04155 [Gemmatimonadaceae bacterium]|jgi:hypothetical protein|nr:hypothetical protein [Gemmatimonadaceae bacterium]